MPPHLGAAIFYLLFLAALTQSPFYKEELSRRGLTPEAYRTSIGQAVKKTSGVSLPKEQAQYEAAMRFAKEVLFEDPAAIARMKQADAGLFSRVKSWTERMHARLSGSSQENAANALWSMYDKADGGSGSGGGTGGSGRTDGPELPPTGDPERREKQAIEAEDRDGEPAFLTREKTVAHENQEGYNEERKTEEQQKTTASSVGQPKEFVLKGTQYTEKYNEKLLDTYNLIRQHGFNATEHALNRILGRINQGKVGSFNDVIDVLKNGQRFKDTIEGGTVLFKNGIAVHCSPDGYIKTVTGKSKIKSTWEEIE